jgi:hypothetical protein
MSGRGKHKRFYSSENPPFPLFSKGLRLGEKIGGILYRLFLLRAKQLDVISQKSLPIA